jgi:hypothetical protein
VLERSVILSALSEVEGSRKIVFCVLHRKTRLMPYFCGVFLLKAQGETYE